MTKLLAAILVSLLALGTFALAAAVLSVRPASGATLGYRGLQRKRILAESALFRLVEPPMRYLASVVSELPLGRLRLFQAASLKRADDFLGLSPDEWSALSLLSGACFFALGLWVRSAVSGSALLPWVGLALGAALPSLRLFEVVRKREKVIGRNLPQSIEIAAMCMDAGLDFPGTLRLLAQDPLRDPLCREFRVILEELDLGHTRREALLQFARRVRSEPVRDFVNAVVQAEEKGNPLAKALQVQGRMLSMRRSVLAEEAAARAGVLMIFQ